MTNQFPPEQNPDLPQTPQQPQDRPVPQTPQYSQPEPGYAPALSQNQSQQKNTLGLVALIFSAVGFLLGIIPVTIWLGWILLPIGFILGLIALFLKNKKKIMAIIAVALAVIGSMVSGVVFTMVLSSIVDDALNEEITFETPAPEGNAPAVTEEQAPAEDASADEEAPATSGDLGSRTNPLPIGSTIVGEEWTVVVNSVDLDASEVVLAENTFNDAPGDDEVYILINITATYTGDDPEGESPWVPVEYVTPSGNTIDVYDNFVFTPEAFDTSNTLYEGASTSGNRGMLVPKDGLEEGVLAIQPGFFSDKAFVAVK